MGVLAGVHLFTLGAERVRRVSIVVGGILVLLDVVDVGLPVWRSA